MTGQAQVVWFKRDLRVHDHAPLADACGEGPVLPIYIIEPDYWQRPDTSTRQWAFVGECLDDLRQALASRGLALQVVEADVLAVLATLHQQLGPFTLRSHQEHGVHWTWQRDKAVAAWCRKHQVSWREYPQFGVQRPAVDRDQWATHWQDFMTSRQHPTPAGARPALASLQPAQLERPRGNDNTPCPGRQRGGRHQGEAVLSSFLQHRGRGYRGGISAPQQAEHAGSRLSPYLAWGCLGMREVVQACNARISEAGQGRWKTSLEAFRSRLWWHCHFIQKFEDETALEWQSMHPLLRTLRGDDAGHRLQAWCQGKTGWPLVDAAMRYLMHNGWLNFRMRAMLVSVASYPLWLHWQRPAQHLGRLFVDYEPGIHYPQVQMQAGVTGINALRMYNPTLQAQRLDPQGHFIRRWVPELAAVDAPWVHQPWLMNRQQQTQSRCRIGHDYPAPLVDFEQATREARSRMKAARQQPGYEAFCRDIFQRHGSRRRPRRRRPQQTRHSANQLSLF